MSGPDGSYPTNQMNSSGVRSRTRIDPLSGNGVVAHGHCGNARLSLVVGTSGIVLDVAALELEAPAELVSTGSSMVAALEVAAVAVAVGLEAAAAAAAELESTMVSKVAIEVLAAGRCPSPSQAAHGHCRYCR